MQLRLAESAPRRTYHPVQLALEARAFTDNVDTAEGSDAHRRVDQERGELDADEDADAQATSLMLSSERLADLRESRRLATSDGVRHHAPERGQDDALEHFDRLHGDLLLRAAAAGNANGCATARRSTTPAARSRRVQRAA